MGKPSICVCQGRAFYFAQMQQTFDKVLLHAIVSEGEIYHFFLKG